MKVLLVEDDRPFAQEIAAALRHENFAVDIAVNGEDGQHLGETENYDAAVLDLGLPKINGAAVLRAWRKNGRHLPVLILTARDGWTDKVDGFKAGADDYLTKPFSIEELLARVRARLRERHPKSNVLVAKNLTMDRDRHEVARDGKAVQLTAKEYALLEYLLLHRNKVHTRDELFNGVWGSDFLGDSNLIDVYIRYLRGKIDDSFEEKLIQTVRGVGYTLKD